MNEEIQLNPPTDVTPHQSSTQDPSSDVVTVDSFTYDYRQNSTNNPITSCMSRTVGEPNEEITLFDEGEEGLISIIDLECPLKYVVIHRSSIRKDMIAIFSDPAILTCLVEVQVIDDHGRQEKGEGKGVILDMITHFWQDCFTSLMVGSSEKIPFIRHDLQKNEWEAVARILVYGYKNFSYFPLKLSYLFVVVCLFGESITTDGLLESFKKYIAAEDREVMDLCLGVDFKEDDEECLEFLSGFKCFKRPTPENIQTIIKELAHQELIQKPKYVINCWTPILSPLKFDPRLNSMEAVDEFYKQKEPTAKKIIKLFKVEPNTEAERQSIDHLKRFVKSLEGEQLAKFLQFCTGSDVIACDFISITFTCLDGLQRRPVARTCVPRIELPTTYESYPALAEEFTNILNDKNSWTFDIV